MPKKFLGNTVNPYTASRLNAFLEAAGNNNYLNDPNILRQLTTSVSCALDEAAAALTRMRNESNKTTSNSTTATTTTTTSIAVAQHSESRSLVAACSEGDVGAVRQLLTEGKSVNEKTEDGGSLLSLACSAGYYELAQVLLAMSANVEDRGTKGDCTPLMEAASSGFVDLVNLLISHGCDVNAQSSSGNTPLMYACAGGHDDVVRVLLEAGANVEDHNENGHTPLMEAASAGHVNIAQILLNYGAGINTHSNEFKESALTLACYKGHLDMVRFLLDAGADQEHKTDEMHTALMEASMDGHVEVARLLLDSGAQVNMPTDSFESPLTLAACGGHVDLALLLIERGANIEEVNDEGYTPLMEAAREGHEDMVTILLDKGANINAQTEETQETALTLACCGGFLEVADFLIKSGAEIELGASTPLMEAAQEGHIELVKYLLEQNANVNAQTQTGDTALTYSCENGHTEVAKLLLQYGADLEHESEGGRTPLMKACRAGHQCTVQYLLSQNAHVNKQTANNDHTPLSLAAAGGHMNVVELLLAHEADPFHKLKDNSTMLIEAAKGGHTAVVQLLLDYPHSLFMSKHSSNTLPPSPPNGSTSPSQSNLIAPLGDLPNSTSVCIAPDDISEEYFPVSKSTSQTLTNVRNDQTSSRNNVSQSLSKETRYPPSGVESTSLPEKRIHHEDDTFDHDYCDQVKIGPSDKEPDKGGTKLDTLLTATPVVSSNSSSILLQPVNSKCTPPSVDDLNGVEFELTEQGSVLNFSTQPLQVCDQAGAQPVADLSDFQFGVHDGVLHCEGVVCSSGVFHPCPHNGIATHVQRVPASLLAQSATSQTLPTSPSQQTIPQSSPITTPSEVSQSTAISDRPKAKVAWKKEGKNARKQTAQAFQAALQKQAHLKYLSQLSDNQEINQMVTEVMHNAYSADPTQLPLITEEVMRMLPNGALFPTDNTEVDLRNDLRMSENGVLESSKSIAQQLRQNFEIAAAVVQQQQNYNKDGIQVPENRVEQLQRRCPIMQKDDDCITQLEFTRSAIENSISESLGAINLEDVGFNNEYLDLLAAATLDEDRLRRSTTSGNIPVRVYSPPPLSSLITSVTHPASNQTIQSSNTTGTTNSPSPTVFTNCINQDPAVVTAGCPLYLYPPSTQPSQISVGPDIHLRVRTDLFSNSKQQHNVQVQATQTNLLPSPIIFQDIPEPISPIHTTPSNSSMIVSNQQTAQRSMLPTQQHVPMAPDPSTVPMPPQSFKNRVLGLKTQQPPTCECHGLTKINENTPPREHVQTGTQTSPQSPTCTPPELTVNHTTTKKVTLQSPQQQTIKTTKKVVRFMENGERNRGGQQQSQKGSQISPLAAECFEEGAALMSACLAMDVDSATDSNNDTALTLACAGGHEELVELLLSRGANIEHRDKKGFTPLILAATAGHEKVVDILLNHSADMEAQSERTKDTPLSLACSGGRFEVVDLLLNRGANKEHRNVSDYTPLSLAASGGYVNIIRLLLSHGAEINSRTGSKLGISPLMLAAMNGHTAAVKLLLDMGSDINAQIETNRNTALTLACFQGRHEVVSLLLDRKANVEHRAKTGLTPLMEAASGGYVEVGRVLLDKGADVNAPPVPSSRDTALTIAADKGHVRFVELLIQRNAQVEVKNKKGNSPLWLAANGGHLAVVEHLYNVGADIDSQDNRKVSCLMAAYRKGHVKVVKWMVNHVNQFPNDQEMTRFLTTISDKAQELEDRCEECIKIIRVAKDQQAARANKNAKILLDELKLEKCREESRKAAAARRRERKKKKKLEKKEEKRKLQEENQKNEIISNIDEPQDDDEEDDDEDEIIEVPELPDKDNLISNEAIINVNGESSSPRGEVEEGDSGIDANSQGSCSSQEVKIPLMKRKDKKKKKPPNQVMQQQQNQLNKCEEKRMNTTITTTVSELPSKDISKAFELKASTNISNINIVKSTPERTNHKRNVQPNSNKDIKNLNGNNFREVTNSNTRMMMTHPADREDFESTGNETYIKSKKNSTSYMSFVDEVNKAANTVNVCKAASKREEGWKEVVRKYLNPPFRSKKVSVPLNAISRVIGRGGSNINAIRTATGAHIEVEKQSKGQGERIITLKGSPDSTKQAHSLISALIKDPDVDILTLLPKSAKSAAAGVWEKSVISAKSKPGKGSSIVPSTCTTTTITKVPSTGSFVSLGINSVSKISTTYISSAPRITAPRLVAAAKQRILPVVTTGLTTNQQSSTSLSTKTTMSYTSVIMTASKNSNAPSSAIKTVGPPPNNSGQTFAAKLSEVSSLPLTITTSTATISTPIVPALMSIPIAPIISSTSVSPIPYLHRSTPVTSVTPPLVISSNCIPVSSKIVSTPNDQKSIGGKVSVSCSIPIGQERKSPSPVISNTASILPTSHAPVITSSATLEYSLFNDTFTKVTQQSMWGKDKEQKGINLAPGSSVSTSTQNQFLQPTPIPLQVDASKAPGYRGNIPNCSPVGKNQQQIMSIPSSVSSGNHSNVPSTSQQLQQTSAGSTNSGPFFSETQNQHSQQFNRPPPSQQHHHQVFNPPPHSDHEIIFQHAHHSRLNPRAPDFSSAIKPPMPSQCFVPPPATFLQQQQQQQQINITGKFGARISNSSRWPPFLPPDVLENGGQTPPDAAINKPRPIGTERLWKQQQAAAQHAAAAVVAAFGNNIADLGNATNATGPPPDWSAIERNLCRPPPQLPQHHQPPPPHHHFSRLPPPHLTTQIVQQPELDLASHLLDSYQAGLDTTGITGLGSVVMPVMAQQYETSDVTSVQTVVPAAVHQPPPHCWTDQGRTISIQDNLPLPQDNKHGWTAKWSH